MTWFNAFMIVVTVIQIVGAAMLVVALLWFLKQLFSGIDLDPPEERYFHTKEDDDK